MCHLDLPYVFFVHVNWSGWLQTYNCRLVWGRLRIQCDPFLTTWTSGKTKPLIDLISDERMQFSELLEEKKNEKQKKKSTVIYYCSHFAFQLAVQSSWANEAPSPTLHFLCAMHNLTVFLSVKCPAIKMLGVYRAKNPTSIEAAIICSTYLFGKKKKIKGEENVFFLLQRCAALSQRCRLRAQCCLRCPRSNSFLS